MLLYFLTYARGPFVALLCQRIGRGGLELPDISPQYSDQREDKLPFLMESGTQYSISGYAKFEGSNEAETGKFLLDANLQLLDRDGNLQPDLDLSSGSRLSYYNGIERIRHKKKFQNGFRAQYFLSFNVWRSYQ